MILEMREHIVIDIKDLMKKYVYYGKNIPYGDFILHPIKVKDSGLFMECAGILDMDKNSIGDVEVIKMSYLKFLGIMSIQEKRITEMLDIILKMSFKLDDDYKVYLVPDKTDYTILISKPEIRGDRIIPDYSNGFYIKSKEFEELRKIILYQNIHDFDDEYIDPDVKKAVEEYNRIVSRDVAEVTADRRIASVQAETGISIRELYNMPYRSFCVLFETMLDNIDYKILKAAEVGGNVEFKRPPEHWVFKKQKGKFGDAFVNIDAVNKKLGVASSSESQKMSEEDYFKQAKERKNGKY